ncbi:MAG: peptidoglycan DD-metalloendopeptidase family protein [Spirochaetes bacterium]|jgi:murein DD-endopeptidase MepM/ murein hydrolase activator NlpD|nr:peptidoglycan DD-metalloendopeptidase family protein [Spirochaetota bacterium]
MMQTRLHRAEFHIIALAILLLAATEAAGQYPRLTTLGSNDVIYKQHQADVAEYYKTSRTGRDLPDLAIYRYKPRESDTLITVASRLMVPYSSLASLNRMAHSEIPDDTEYLLVPSVPGIFVPETPVSELENLMWDLRGNRRDEAQRITVTADDEAQRFRFFPGSDFDRVERLAFLRLLFQRPVANTVISSHFGYRNSPITARPQFHGGVDFAAPTGTSVVAAREGRVTDTGFHSLYGNYVLLRHDGGYETFYGHLHEIKARLNDQVSSGMMIGTVGNSGRSTGPHLHFEIRQHGKHRDPLHHLPGLTR